MHHITTATHIYYYIKAPSHTPLIIIIINALLLNTPINAPLLNTPINTPLLNAPINTPLLNAPINTPINIILLLYNFNFLIN